MYTLPNPRIGAVLGSGHTATEPSCSHLGYYPKLDHLKLALQLNMQIFNIPLSPLILPYAALAPSPRVSTAQVPQDL